MNTLIDQRISELQQVREAKLQVNKQLKHLAKAKEFLNSIEIPSNKYHSAQYTTDDKLSDADTDTED